MKYKVTIQNKNHTTEESIEASSPHEATAKILKGYGHLFGMGYNEHDIMDNCAYNIVEGNTYYVHIPTKTFIIVESYQHDIEFLSNQFEKEYYNPHTASRPIYFYFANFLAEKLPESVFNDIIKNLKKDIK